MCFYPVYQRHVANLQAIFGRGVKKSAKVVVTLQILCIPWSANSGCLTYYSVTFVIVKFCHDNAYNMDIGYAKSLNCAAFFFPR